MYVTVIVALTGFEKHPFEASNVTFVRHEGLYCFDVDVCSTLSHLNDSYTWSGLMALPLSQ